MVYENSKKRFRRHCFRAIFPRTVIYDFLIECCNNMHPNSAPSNDYLELNQRIAEMIAEVLCHTRAIIMTDSKVKTDPTSFLIEAQNNAKNYIKKLIGDY